MTQPRRQFCYFIGLSSVYLNTSLASSTSAMLTSATQSASPVNHGACSTIPHFAEFSGLCGTHWQLYDAQQNWLDRVKLCAVERLSHSAQQQFSVFFQTQKQERTEGLYYLHDNTHQRTLLLYLSPTLLPQHLEAVINHHKEWNHEPSPG